MAHVDFVVLSGASLPHKRHSLNAYHGFTCVPKLLNKAVPVFLNELHPKRPAILRGCHIHSEPFSLLKQYHIFSFLKKLYLR